MVEIDQHHYAGFGGDAGKRDEADDDGHRKIEAEPPHQPNASDQGEGQREHDDHRVSERAEVEIEQQKDDQQGYRHHDLQTRRRALEILELSAPYDVGARRKLNARLHRLLRVGDVAAEIAVADIDIDVHGKLPVLGADRGRATRRRNLGDLPERHGTAGRHWDQDVIGDALRIVAEIPRVTHVDADALAAFHGGGHGLAAKRGADDVLDILNHDAIARERGTVRRHVEIVAAERTLSVSRRGSRDGLEDLLDLLGEL